ncbi:MAG: nucleotide-binding protein [Pyrinomonadaceae bacterium]
MLPRLFIGSSVESLDVAHAVQENLDNYASVTVWDQGVFEPSGTNLESLLAKLDSSDFGLFILTPDDVTILRGNEVKTARDNIIFELGLYIGRLGLSRTFFLISSDTSDLHQPTDLLGIIPLKYSTVGKDSILSAVGPACNKIRRQLENAVMRRAPGRHGKVTILPNVNEGSLFAAECVKKASTIRVIGTARQDVAGSDENADGYLKATEDRFKSGDKLTYMRITSSRITAPFKKHLSQLFELSKPNASIRFEIAIDPSNLDVAVSYMVFDEAGVLMAIDNNFMGNRHRDNQLFLWSSDTQVVKAFKEHFDDVWLKLPIKIRSKSTLHNEVKIRK